MDFVPPPILQVIVIFLVPMLRVGMQFVMLWVTGREASLYEFPRRPWELVMIFTLVDKLILVIVTAHL